MKKAFKINFVLLLSGFLLLPAVSVDAQGRLEPRKSVDDSGEVRGVQDTERVKKLVEQEFGDGHPMVEVARCESDFRQFSSDGDVLRNSESDALGVFQLIEDLHEEPADELGLDIFTAEGNIAYARKLYDSFGLEPWSPSSLCWDDGSIEATDLNSDEEAKPEQESTRVPVRVKKDGELEIYEPGGNDSSDEQGQTDESIDPIITKKLVSGVRHQQVRTLQQLLNDAGYQLSSSGPGSPGQETDFFGAKTRQAIQEFQCEQDIVCSGSRYSTGYGLVGEETREQLNELAAERAASKNSFDGVPVRTSSNTENEDNLQENSNSDSGISDTSTNEELTQELVRAQSLVDELAAQINN